MQMPCQVVIYIFIIIITTGYDAARQIGSALFEGKLADIATSRPEIGTRNRRHLKRFSAAAKQNNCNQCVRPAIYIGRRTEMKQFMIKQSNNSYSMEYAKAEREAA